MSHSSKQPVDVVRKASIIIVLFVYLVLMYQYASAETTQATILLAVGFVILASYTIGELAEFVKLPHITGYLLAGLFLGGSAAHTLGSMELLQPYIFAPFDRGLLNHDVIGKLGLLDTLALALICLTAGGELKLDALRSGLGRILSILAAQTVTIMVGMTAVIYLISGAIPFFTFEPLAGLGVGPLLGVGAVFASISLATAPAATIAIINSTGAKGPMTSNVLPVVVLKDVVVVIAFSVSMAIASGLMPGAAGGSPFSKTLLVIVASVALGVGVGGVVHLYLRYVGAEILLFIVGMVYATDQAALFMTHLIDPHSHAELALVFIAAGFTTSNFSPKGDELIHQVERLSLPVYVIFFTMAGAKLHIEDLLSSGQFAVVLVAARVALLGLGVRLGATFSGADESTRRYGWMGFISQAGLALTLAGTVKQTFGEGVGDGLFSLILGGVALNEVIGPVLLQLGLGFAGETAEHHTEHHDPTEEEAYSPASVALLAWRREQTPDRDPWGAPIHTTSPELNEAISSLELELRQLIRDFDVGPLTSIEDEHRAYIRDLRRDFLRCHRHIMTHCNRTESSELRTIIRAELGELSGRWRDQLLNRSASLSRPTWSPKVIQDAVDRQVAELPELILLPVEPRHLDPHESDTAWQRWQRRLLRIRAKLTRAERQVRLRDLGRYHLQGVAAAKMEGLAAILVNADLHLADRTATLFNAIEEATNRLISYHPDHTKEEMNDALKQVRSELEVDFELALNEVSWIDEDTLSRTASILGGAVRTIKAEVQIYDTPDLPQRQRRFAKVFEQRTKGLLALTTGLDAARKTAASRYGALALAFEVVDLEGKVKEAVDAHGDLLKRQIRGKGLKQVQRVREGVATVLSSLEQMLADEELKGEDMALQISQGVVPVEKTVEDALESAAALRDWLAAETSDEPLLDAILSAAQGLTERYDVATGPPKIGEWALPEPMPTMEVPFREVAVSFIEAHITRELIEVTRRTAVQVDTLVHVLQDVARVLRFNADLAQAELEVSPGVIAQDTRDLVAEMLLGSWGRSAKRLDQTYAEAETLPNHAAAEVRDIVLGRLEEFRNQIFDGRITNLRNTLLREVHLHGNFFTRSRVRHRITKATYEAVEVITHTLGEERIATLRHTLGLTETVQVADPSAFAPPCTLTRLPTVYRRLFSDHALEAGDLLTGRDAEYATALAALRADHVGVFRTVAIVGLDGIGKRALANALVRGLGSGRVVRRSPTEPLHVDTVARWFDDQPGGVVVIEGFENFFQVSPGGFRALKRFVHGIVEDDGKTAFIVLFDKPVWHFAQQASNLDNVFAEVIEMRTLTKEEIEVALLARHKMSGYELQFQPGTDLAWKIADLLSRGSSPEERLQNAWFRTLHEASSGIMHDALRLWMSSVLDVDETRGVIRMGPVPRPPTARIRRLPRSTLLTLRQVLCQGSTTAELHSGQFRVTLKDAETELAALAHAGLLVAESGRYVVSPHLMAPVVSALSARGWFA